MEDQGLRCEGWTVDLVKGCTKIKKNEDSKPLHSEPKSQKKVFGSTFGRMVLEELKDKWQKWVSGW